MSQMGSSLMITALVAASGCAEQPSPAVGAVADEAVSQPNVCDWPQMFGAATHAGKACIEQRGMQVVAQIVTDPDADTEDADNGFLQIHYGSPLTSGDFVILPAKRGYGGNGFNADGTLGPRPAETWSVQAWHWVPSVSTPGATLQQLWAADTTWEPIDTVIGSFASYTNGYLQEFGGAIANGSVYSLGARGTLQRRAIKTGALTSTINPLLGTPFAGDALTLADGPPSVDDATGTLYYTLTAYPLSGGRGAQPRGSWLAVVHSDDTTQLIPWAQIASASVGVPQSTDLCAYHFGTSGTPGPTGPDSQPPKFGCGTQRPALNVAPTIGNGELAVLSAANNQVGAEFVITLSTSTWQPTAAYDTRGHMLTGCGVRLDVTAGDCPVITANGTTHLGFDPSFNAPTSFTGSDIMNDAIVIAPNGDLSVSGYDSGFSFGGDYDARGGIVTFRRSLGAGSISVNDDFGWEVTPAVLPLTLVPPVPNTFVYLADRNLYSSGILGTASYGPDWTLRNHGEPTIVGINAIDFLDNQVAFDPSGNRYGINGDGFFYKFSSTGAILEQIALPGADGPRSIETESNHIARDRAGRLYATYGGSVYVLAGGSVGSPGGTGTTARAQVAPMNAAAAAKLGAQRDAKMRALANVLVPVPPLEHSSAVVVPLQLQPHPESITCVPQPCVIGILGNSICAASCGLNSLCASEFRCVVHTDGTLSPECGGGFGRCIGLTADP